MTGFDFMAVLTTATVEGPTRGNISQIIARRESRDLSGEQTLNRDFLFQLLKLGCEFLVRKLARVQGFFVDLARLESEGLLVQLGSEILDRALALLNGLVVDPARLKGARYLLQLDSEILHITLALLNNLFVNLACLQGARQLAQLRRKGLVGTLADLNNAGLLSQFDSEGLDRESAGFEAGIRLPSTLKGGVQAVTQLIQIVSLDVQATDAARCVAYVRNQAFKHQLGSARDISEGVAEIFRSGCQRREGIEKKYLS